jgi:predicted kinase
MKPLLIIVSGAPGSGKTTFASKLAAHMQLLHIERDRAFDAMQYTYTPNAFSREKDGIPLFHELIASMLKSRASIVVDATLYKGKSEKDIIQFQQYANMINTHCRSTNEHERFYKREVAKAGKIPDWLPAHMPKLDVIYDLVREPLELHCPLIEANTTHMYNPDIQTIVTRITKLR